MDTDLEQDAVPLAGSRNTLAELLLSEKEFVRKHFEHLSPVLKVGCYDVMILYHEDDYKRADEFKQALCNIELRNGTKLKAALHDDPDFMSLSGAEFENLEQAFERCTFAFVFLSEIFVKDTWCKIVSQSFMIKMINDPTKRWSVVPVLTSQKNKLNFNIPLGLNAIRELKFYPPIEMFTKCVMKLVSDTYNVRAGKEKILLSRRFFFLSQLLKCKEDSRNSIEITGARNNDITQIQRRDEESFPEGVQQLNIHGNRQTSVVDDLETDGLACDTFTKPSASGCNSSCQSNFLKKTDDKDLIRNNRLVSKASHSVGIIKGPFSLGTGFRVGTKYLATARHVVVENTAINGKIDIAKIRSSGFFVEFEYIRDNQQHKETNIFYFINVSYENTNFDTMILELKEEDGKTFPPPISLISDVNTKSSVYIIGHPNGLPQMVDPKISFYKYNKDEVDKSKAWAASEGITADDYVDIESKDKVLFHCASQHGASGALGVMIDQSFDEPQSVVMLLRGFPEFYYGKESFTDSDKEKFLIVEQGVLLSSVYKDMERQPKYNDIVKDILSTLQNPKED